MKYLLSLFILCLYAFPVFAQDFGQNDQPIEISADDNLEWLQKEKQYVANGNAEIIQGGNKINANKIIADYRENEDTSKTEIWQVTAIDNVQLTDEDSVGNANKAIYNFDTGNAILSGGTPTLKTPEQTITANDALEYNMNTGVATATGNAKITRGTDSLTANKIVGRFGKDKAGKQVLNTAKAYGGVTIKTSDEKITGNQATYNAQQNTAQIKGNVKITRGLNTLEGARAEVNLNTNLSKIYGAPKENKRVKGVFYPSSRNTSNTAP